MVIYGVASKKDWNDNPKACRMNLLTQFLVDVYDFIYTHDFYNKYELVLIRWEVGLPEEVRDGESL